jgi:SMI1-KNR4 cell-wall
MEDVISELKQVNEPVPVPLELPDMDDIVDVEEQLLISLDAQFREFLLTVSDVIYGSLEPVTITDPHSHTYLPEVAAVAWSVGLPRELIPLCESNGDYYCVDELGEVRFWQQESVSEESWPSIWHWAKEVWLDS